MSTRVLAVDNDLALRKLLEQALRRAGFEPRVVRQASEAEALLRAGEADFLLLDLNLGSGQSGDVVAERWRQDGLLPPFLVLTGAPEDPRLDALRAMPGFQGVLAKPFSVLELMRLLPGEGAVQES